MKVPGHDDREVRTMRPRTAAETAIICAAGVLALALLMVPFEISRGGINNNGKMFVWLAVAGVLALGLVQTFRYLTTRKHAQIETGEQYRRLADEYRRLSDLAITAQEHTDLKLADLCVQVDYLRQQNENLQKILKEVE
jgi:hypothetical protein